MLYLAFILNLILIIKSDEILQTSDSTKVDNLSNHISTILPDGFVSINVSNKALSNEVRPIVNQTGTEPNQAFINMELNQNNTNFVYNGKLLVNNSNNPPGLLGVSRNIELKQPVQKDTSSNKLFIGIFVTVVALICLVIVITAAIFITRRKIRNWPLNGSKSNLNECNDGANGVLTNTNSSENPSENKCEAVNENEVKRVIETVENPNNEMTSVENKEAIQQINELSNVNQENGHSNEAADGVIEDKAASKPIEHGSPSSGSLLINNNLNEITEKPNTLITEQNSSTSLIVNVLNELSESVACKLASKSPAKSQTNLASDPEKQPLNNE